MAKKKRKDVQHEIVKEEYLGFLTAEEIAEIMQYDKRVVMNWVASRKLIKPMLRSRQLRYIWRWSDVAMCQAAMARFKKVESQSTYSSVVSEKWRTMPYKLRCAVRYFKRVLAGGPLYPDCPDLIEHIIYWAEKHNYHGFFNSTRECWCTLHWFDIKARDECKDVFVTCIPGYKKEKGEGIGLIEEQVRKRRKKLRKNVAVVPVFMSRSPTLQYKDTIFEGGSDDEEEVESTGE